MKIQRGQIGLVGEYAVLSALILHGFNAAKMDGNSKDIDILYTNSDFSNATKIQVKTEGPQAFYRGSKNSSPLYSFFIVTLDKYNHNYRQAILDQRIYKKSPLCSLVFINEGKICLAAKSMHEALCGMGIVQDHSCYDTEHFGCTNCKILKKEEEIYSKQHGYRLLSLLTIALLDLGIMEIN